MANFRIDFSNGESGIFFVPSLDFDFSEQRLICPSGKVSATAG
jgi:hypothetical protein